jgi:hypothetical protein
MGIIISTNSIVEYSKINYREQIDLINDIQNNKDITNYGINLKISTLSIISNLLNKPNSIINSDFDINLTKYYDTLTNNIRSNLRLKNGIIYKYIHYNDQLEITINHYKFIILAKKL